VSAALFDHRTSRAGVESTDVVCDDLDGVRVVRT
jgi:hypothetical protein